MDIFHYKEEMEIKHTSEERRKRENIGAKGDDARKGSTSCTGAWASENGGRHFKLVRIPTLVTLEDQVRNTGLEGGGETHLELFSTEEGGSWAVRRTFV